MKTAPPAADAAKARWERETLEPALAKSPERAGAFTTVSGRPIERLYTPADVAGLDYARDLGDPGAFPYTRGIHASGYRGKLWTMRQFAGFGTPAETNERYKQLLAAGGTGLSVAFDLPTLMGRDPDHPLSLGEVGKCGVSVVSLGDMERLFDGIRLADITTSMTINSPAAMIFAMYLVVAERQGADWRTLSGTIQNDILKEFIAQKEYIYPPRPSMRLVTDVFAFCADRGAALEHDLGQRLPHSRGRRDGACRNWRSRCATASSTSSTASTPASTSTRSRRASRSSSTRTTTSSRRSRSTARPARIWARVMRDRFGAKDERSWKLRFHTQTAGVSLTAQQPYNNVVRTAIQALAAVLGGTNSLHTNSLDEALALPTAEAATLALRTQQIIAHESGVTNVVDPLGGSYFVESLTRDMIDGGRRATSTAIDGMGGMVAAIEAGFPQREIAESAYRFQQAVERREKIIVGVNDFVAGRRAAGADPLHRRERAATPSSRRSSRFGATRDADAVRPRRSRRVRAAARGADNLMYPLLDAVRAYATVGEMCDALRDVWGE